MTLLNENSKPDDFFMREALKQAELALSKDEVPIGAVIAIDNTIIAKGYNQTEMLKDVTAHAEMIAFTAASAYLNGKYLTGCTLYVTIEPCVMCAGAAFWTQISRVVFGAPDDKRGYHLKGNLFHPKTEISSQLLKEECSALLSSFFQRKRKSGI